MKHVFSVMGGSGSTYIRDSLAQRYTVADKPDTIFRRDFPHLRIEGINTQETTFEERAKIRFALQGDFFATMANYLAYVHKSERYTATLNTCAEVGAFSQLGIADVVFFIRHPVNAYASWTKDIRHGNAISALGGIASHRAIQFFCNRWNRIALEYLTLEALSLRPVLVRFESALEDVRAFPELSWLFADFETSRSSAALLSGAVHDRVKHATAPLFSRIYHDLRL